MSSQRRYASFSLAMFSAGLAMAISSPGTCGSPDVTQTRAIVLARLPLPSAFTPSVLEMFVDDSLELHPERVPLANGFVVAVEDAGALVVEAHPFDRHSREHPEPHQVQPEADSDQRLSAGLHGVPLSSFASTGRSSSRDTGKQRACHGLKARDFANFNLGGLVSAADCPSESGEKSPM